MGTYGGPTFYSQLAQQEMAEAQQRAEWAHRQRQFQNNYSARPAPRATAAQLLGVAEDASAEDIKHAFTAKVKEAHPDAGGKGGDIAALKAARDLLLTTEFKKDTLKEELTCPLCKGTGMVSSGFGAMQCQSCGGSGNVI